MRGLLVSILGDHVPGVDCARPGSRRDTFPNKPIKIIVCVPAGVASIP